MAKRLPVLFWPAAAASVVASMVGIKGSRNAGMEPSPFAFAEPHEALAAFSLIVGVMLLVRYIRTPRRPVSDSSATYSHMGSNRRDLLLHIIWTFFLMVGLPLVWIVTRENVPALLKALLKPPTTGLVPAVIIVGALCVFSRGAGTGKGGAFKPWRVWAALPYFILRAGIPEEFLFSFCILQASVQAWGAWPAVAFTVCLFSGCHVVTQVGGAVRASTVVHVPWRLVALQQVTLYVPVTFIVCYVWLTTASLILCVLLHAFIDAWYLETDFLEAVQTTHAR